jgi:hypothetical protein
MPRSHVPAYSLTCPPKERLSDRREVSPPIEVESLNWSTAGDLDYWVKEHQERWAGYGVQTDITCGSELLIYVRPKSTDSRELLLSFVVPFLSHTGAAARTLRGTSGTRHRQCPAGSRSVRSSGRTCTERIWTSEDDLQAD